MFRIALFCALLCLCACSTTPVTLAPGQASDISEYLAENWLPGATRAQDDYRKLMRERAGMASVKTIPVVLAASKTEADKIAAARPNVFVSNLGNFPPDVFLTKTIVDPVRASAQLLFVPPAHRPAAVSPAWLARGVATQIAFDVLRMQKGLNALAERILRSDTDSELRAAKTPANVTDVLRLSVGTNTAQFFAVADYMAETLKLRLGEAFYRALSTYLGQIDSGKLADQAFENAFGISLDAFGVEAEASLTALRAQQRSHISENAEWIEASEALGRTALSSKSTRDAFERYKKKTSPKAFVRARSGTVVFFDDRSEALPLALEKCKTVDPLGCKVVAIDNRFVIPESARPADIDVRLASHGEDAWTNEVRTKWMPVLRSTVDHFNHVVEKQFGHSLKEAIRIHVVSNREDYALVLREELRQSRGNAERSAELSSGLANQQGQMLISLYSRTPPEFLREVAITVTLHELTHELQGQLRGGSAGFSPVRWLDEASADQIANIVGKELTLDPSEKFVLQDWRESVIEWYRLKGKRATKPEEVVDTNFPQWLALVRDGRNPYQMSGMMAVHLADRVGADYLPALLRYWTLAAHEGEKEALAFEKCFGMSKEDFMASLNKWLVTL